MTVFPINKKRIFKLIWTTKKVVSIWNHSVIADHEMGGLLKLSRSEKNLLSKHRTICFLVISWLSQNVYMNKTTIGALNNELLFLLKSIIGIDWLWLLVIRIYVCNLRFCPRKKYNNTLSLFSTALYHCYNCIFSPVTSFDLFV